MNTIDIDLDLPPEKRWRELRDYREQVHPLGEQILRDILPQYNFITAAAFGMYRKLHSNKEYLRELHGMSKYTGVSYEHLCLLNYYYDLLKVYFDGLSFGCSSFAANTSDGPVHARNLDWPSDGGLLSVHSLIQNYYRSGKLLFTSIGWPAYNTVLSGIAPGRFSITLNTVSSKERGKWARSITYSIREVFESGCSYEGAVSTLKKRKVMSDCILTVCGVKEDQFCVIERSPGRGIIRQKKDWVAATNDYRTELSENKSKLDIMLSGDSCDRYDTLEYLLNEKLPAGPATALEYVKHPFVMNDITMQHMVFHPASGEIIGLCAK